MKLPFKKIEKCGMFYVTIDGAPFSTTTPGTTECDAQRLVDKLNKAYEMGYIDYKSELGEEEKRLYTCKDCRAICVSKGSNNSSCEDYI